MIKIQIAAPDDIQAVCDIIQQMTPGQKHNYWEAVEKYKYHMMNNPDYYLWVAKDGDDEVTGTAMMHVQHKLSYKCGQAAHLEDVVVDEGHRNEGVGDILVRRAITTARELGCYKLMLTCYPKTITYYERFDFVKHDVGMRLNLKEQLYD